MIQRLVNNIRLLFDYRPVDRPNAPIEDTRVSKWYRSIGLFEGKKDGKPLAIHLLQTHDKREFAILINGKDIKTVSAREKIRLATRVASRFLAR